MRRALPIALALALSACGPEDGLGRLRSSPAITAADAGYYPLPDAGAAAIRDAGEDVLAACAAAAGDLEHCELADGGPGSARRGAICGEPCTGACTEGRCRDGAVWNSAVCGPAGTWSTNGACDDGNPCTSGDHCQAGACAGANDDSQSCSDNDICTVGDHCSAGHCIAGARNTAVWNRYFNSGVLGYDYDNNSPASGWSDEGPIYASAPGGQTIHLLFNNVEIDRLLEFATSDGAWADTGITVGKGYDHQEPGTVKLQRVRYLCSGGSSLCNGHVRHYLWTAGHGGPPGGATNQDSGIWVCPVP